MTPYEFPQHDPGDEDARQRYRDLKALQEACFFTKRQPGQPPPRMEGSPRAIALLAEAYKKSLRTAEDAPRTNSWRG